MLTIHVLTRFCDVVVKAFAPSLGDRPSHTKDLKKKKANSASLLDPQHLKGQSTDNAHRLASMGRRKFLRKCPAECGEKGGTIVVMLLVRRVPWESNATSSKLSGCVCLI